MADVATLGIAIKTTGAEDASQKLKTLSANAADAEKRILAFEEKTGIAAKRAKENAKAHDESADAFKRTGAAIDNADRSTKTWLDTWARRVVIGLAANEARKLAGQLIIMNSELERAGDLSRRIGISSGAFQGLEAAAGFKGINSQDLAKGMQEFAERVNEARNNANDLYRLFQLNNKSLTDQRGNMRAIDDLFATGADLVRNARTEMDKFNILQQLGLPATREWVKLMEQGGPALKKAIDDAKASGLIASNAVVDAAERFDSAWNKAWTNIRLYSRATAGSIIDDLQKADITAGKGAIGRWLLYKLGFVTPGAQRRAAEPFGPPMPAGGIQFGPEMPAGFKPPATVNQKDIEASLSREQQRIGLLGELATVQDKVRSKDNEIAQAGLQRVFVTDAQLAALKRLAEFQAQANKLSERVQFGTANPGEIHAQQSRELQRLIDFKIVDVRSTSEMVAANNALSKKYEELTASARIAGAALPDLQRSIEQMSSLRGQVDRFSTSTLSGFSESMLEVFNTKTTAEIQAQSKHWEDLAKQGKNGTIAFEKLGDTVVRSLEKMAIEMAITTPIAKMLQATMSSLWGGSFGNLFGPTTATSGPLFAPTAHMGGIIGSDPLPGRFVHPAYYEHAPRFHRGGILPGEVPAILKRGEGVFTRPQMAALGGGMGGGGDVTVIMNNAPAGVAIEKDKTKHTRAPGGGVQLDVWFKNSVLDVVHGDMANPNGRLNQLQGAFGVDRTRGMG
jgi:hypothetical protein